MPKGRGQGDGRPDPIGISNLLVGVKVVNGMELNELDGEPCYVISVAARLAGLRTQTLRYYERMGLVEPSRSGGNLRLYSPRDLRRIHLIKQLTNDLGVNLAGVEVILRLLGQMDELESKLQEFVEELERRRRPALPGRAARGLVTPPPAEAP